LNFNNTQKKQLGGGKLQKGQKRWGGFRKADDEPPSSVAPKSMGSSLRGSKQKRGGEGGGEPRSSWTASQKGCTRSIDQKRTNGETMPKGTRREKQPVGSYPWRYSLFFRKPSRRGSGQVFQKRGYRIISKGGKKGRENDQGLSGPHGTRGTKGEL